MQTGIYRKIEGHTGVGMLYQFLLLAREHTTGEQAVVYIPLRVEPEWGGTVRPCYMPRAAFERKFSYVGEGLPVEPIPNPLNEHTARPASPSTAIRGNRNDSTRATSK